MTDEDAGSIITFYSYTGGTGRTMALANTAWILASSGKRVLVVDWDLDAPGLDRFLHPFLERDKLLTTPGVLELVSRFAQSLVEAQRFAEIQGHDGRAKEQAPVVDEAWVAERARFNHCVIPVIWDFPRSGRLDFLPAGTKNKGYLSAFSQFHWHPFLDSPPATEFIGALKREFVQNYDYVLIDSRTGLGDIADICTVSMPHTLVLCFTPSSQSIDGSAAVAERIEAMYNHRNIRILPVPLRVEASGRADRLDAARAQIRLRFARILSRHSTISPQDYWGQVEIPYRPDYSYEELLAPFRDAPGSHSSLLAAYERLTAVVSDGVVTSMPHMDEGMRRRCLDLFTRRRPLDVCDVYISYVPQDRIWAEWIRAVLEAAEFRVHMAQEGTDEGSRLRTETERGVESTTHTLVVLSGAYLRSSRFRATWETVFSHDRLGNRRLLVPVRVEDVAVSAPFTERLVDLTRCDTGDVAREILLRGFDAAPLPQPRAHPIGPDRSPRYPGAEPSVWSVPLRSTSFTGRTELLETIRERLRTGKQAILLGGMGGVGKTLLAQEFAHRYKGDYDVVWYIQAEQRNLAVEMYAQMAQPLGLAERKNPTATAQAVRDALVRGEPYHRWLLILDNADEARSFNDLLAPGRSGHILVTSQRSEGWSQYAETVEVGVFSRQESVSHLRRRLPDCGPEEADLVADALGDLPIAVEQAAAFIKQAGLSGREYIRLLQRPTTGTDAHGHGDEAADLTEAVHGTWGLAMARLRAHYQPALRLLQLGSFFSPEPISMDLLQGVEIARAMGGGGPAVARAYQELSRFSLARVDRKARALQVHRLVQLSVRHSMTEEEQEDTREVVYRALVAARPGKDDPEDPNTWDQYRIIWPHLGTPWALTTSDNGIRELIVDRVRQLRRRGELANALELSRRCEAGWHEAGDPDGRWTLHIRFQIANILRAQGAYGESLALDEEVLERQLALFRDKDDQHVLMTTSSIAADLRALGRFSEALEYDRETHERYCEHYGEDHPRTLDAASNLAMSLRACGDYYAACDLDRKTFETREEILLPDHPLTIESAVNLGRGLRDCGDYAASVDLLKRAHERCLRNAEFTESAPTVLSTVKGLAASLRSVGSVAEAEQLTRHALSHTPAVDGGSSPERLLLEMNLAADLMALDRAGEARELLRTVLDGLRRSLGEMHPFTVACSANHALHLLGAGEVAEAGAVSERAVADFTELLGEHHPLVLVARVNLANAQAEEGHREDARRTYESVFDQLREVLGRSHPLTLVCAGNLAVLLRELGDEREGETMRDAALTEMARRLGADHPRTMALESWCRTGLEIDPYPI